MKVALWNFFYQNDCLFTKGITNVYQDDKSQRQCHNHCKLIVTFTGSGEKEIKVEITGKLSGDFEIKQREF